MIKKIALTALAASALGFAIPASALTGVYVNGNIGYAEKDIDSASKFGFTSDDEGNFAWSAFVGYNYDFNEMFGLAGEFGYADYDDADWKGSGIKADSDQTAWQLNLVGTWHINEMFDVFGKVGAAFAEHDVNSDTVSAVDHSENETRPLIALGAGYNFTPEFAVQVMWEHLFGNADIDEVNTVDSFMLGLKYTFEI